ncbi:uncharacterized protein E0L32_012391 [Thyridium curvatum]|uniref:Zn(2)-C6 fungal-type domain-containing protein n=1 Tax=Thyridium curvatum TaxID=1093900 RepID=A0A507B3E1_9PEZI|nr:uncharacterized protein E0L32_012391 [Thyridium curvatum]TPX16772.1 hypothetical protein E0L32_012391 [Thyridium curvatum]
MMPAISGTSPPRQYRRGYAACTVCRSHKVKCVLGTGPPCAKCRREHRECVFDRTKRGPRTRNVSQWAEATQPPIDTGGRVATDAAEAQTEPQTWNNDTASRTTGSETNRRKDASILHRVPAHSPASLLERTMCPSEALGFFNEPRVSQEGAPSGSIPVSPFPAPASQQKRTQFGNPWHPPSVDELSQLEDGVLDVWNQIPYVRMGWFTAQEALTYMDLFHRHLSPFCPAFMSEIEIGKSRYARIAQEPMLCTTILMIASRFFTLPGSGGLTRFYLIHHHLWQQCERLIQLLMYGQEKYLRGSHTWATLQSLLLLSEWHPRALRSVSTTQNETWQGTESRLSGEAASEGREQSPASRYEQELLARAKHSDRISWMMVGAALNLGHEAGVFVDACFSSGTLGSDWLGPLHTRKLLYVYVTNLSVRLGFQNTFTQDVILARAVLPVEGIDRSGTDSNDVSMELWLSLVRLSRAAAAIFFRSPTSTKDHLRNGDYIIMLQSFVVTLSKWYDDFVASQLVMNQAVQSLLLIEYHHLRTYTHALAIQAVLERSPSQTFTTCQKKDRLELLSTCYLPEDFAFINEVITNSTSVLRITMAMADNGRLRFVPIRQLQSILSAFLFLFKAIPICTSREDVQTALSDLEQCAKALGEADMDELDVSRDTLTFFQSHVRKIRKQVNIFFSASTNPEEALVAQVLADLSEPSSSGDGESASTSLLPGVNWNQEVFSIPGLPADFATSWHSLDAFSRLAGIDSEWQPADRF